jgi:hypothetical protein
MKALITDTIKFTFFTATVAAFAGVGTTIVRALGLVPHRAHRAA